MEAWEKHYFVLSALKKRGVQLEDVCPLCGLTNETTDHLFMQCPQAKLTWSSSPLGLHVPPNTSCSNGLIVRRRKGLKLSAPPCGCFSKRGTSPKQHNFNLVEVIKSAMVFVREYNEATNRRQIAISMSTLQNPCCCHRIVTQYLWTQAASTMVKQVGAA